MRAEASSFALKCYNKKLFDDTKNDFKNDLVILYKMRCNIFLVCNYVKGKNCYDQASANKPSGLDSNRCSPDAFVHPRDISCSRREFFGGVKATLLLGRPAVGRFRAIPLPAFGMWVAASRVAMSPVRLHCAVTCLWESRLEQRSALLTHRAKPNVVRESRF